MIHGHGDDLYRAGQRVKANFSTNVWYGSDFGLLQKALEKKLESVLHYPEPDAGSFCQAVACFHGLKVENVIAGNGATELFYLVGHAFAGGRTLLPVPSFSEYEDACTMYNHQIDYIPVSELSRLRKTGGLMFICNPNNPDGRMWNREDIRCILESYPDMVLVVDESFIDFAPETPSVVNLLLRFPNLLVIRSMTKAYAIPGLRLGYMLGDARLIEFIGCFRHPWSVNALAIEVGKYLLESGAVLLPDAVSLLQRQKAFSGRMGEIPGFRPLPSCTSFFLTETDWETPRLRQYLLERHGLLIRDASNFRGLSRHYFRVNTLTDENNELLLMALKQYNGLI